MTPALHAVTAAEAPLLAALHASAFPPAEAWSAEAIGSLLTLPGCFGLRADAAGFALARIAAEEAELLTLAVHPAARRQGLGAGLLAAVAACAAENGACALFLEVGAANSAALGLYLSVGGRQVGLRRGYYADGGDALVMRVPINPFAARDV